MALEILMWVGVFVVSLGGLLKASDWFVDAAEVLGLNLGIPSFIIGVTIVAVGTSLPELATSIAAVYGGNPEIVAGNAIGSNIANICLVLAIIAIVGKKIKLSFDIMSTDMPILMCSALLLYFVIQPDSNGVSSVNFFEAILLLAGMIVFLMYSFSSDGDEDEEKVTSKVSIKTILTLLGSGALIYFGASYTVVAIQKLSGLVGLNTESLALSLVAIGTSLPEIIVSVAATRKGKAEIAIGNVLGSNIFNTFGVMGIPALLGDLEVSQDIVNMHLPLMMGASIIFLIMMLSKTLSRWEGMMLLLFYVFFLSSLF